MFNLFKTASNIVVIGYGDIGYGDILVAVLSVWGYPVWNLFHVTILVLRTMKRVLCFWKICTSCTRQT